MTSSSDPFSIAEDGTIQVAGASGETNVAVWNPSLPTAFDNARDATYFTRLETHHPHQELKAAFDVTPNVDQTFCLSVNNVILVFSLGTPEEHHQQVRKVLAMMRTHSMRADGGGCVFDARTSADAGILLDQVGQNKVFMVINQGPPRR
ncbi:hypothetical protein BHE90_005232 [Fusarium euwallaceae]|uniref:Uncharacterized protein n=4 Tax=Fusarium solani species complex TaxID=232080 RepID=A0A3M2RYQ4_9HYPO|nr:hypothetical protein CDV36_009941 [Fusarium kuroshium]RSL69601.1 hypothetical protein CEP51_012319 [Fusarium floridanum]RSM06992.1 hypothetical protein CDV31_008834 [Fusarium ambrosium]RTE80274.1 hypothetical protein BHE90_005232 [Fusarium euwallaceae]